jgi:hypothetical protein
MKPIIKIYISLLLFAGLLPASLLAQWQPKIAHLRAYDKSGINVFEDLKSDTVAYTGLKVKFGAGFTQQFQNLKVENPGANNSGTTNKLRPVSAGFQTAQANLYMDVQLADGIRLNLTSYLSSKHHNETWVKGGYIQFDKLPFKGKVWNDIMSVTTIKVGHFEVNYGDEHFRRTDGGAAIYNPFMEGNIMDEFATEIGGEVYVKKNGLFGMMGVTNGMIKGYVDSATQGIVNGEVVDANTNRSPSVYFKGGFDKKLGDIVRVRLSASYYHNGSSGGSGLTLFGGDRTGSNYQNVMELNSAAASSATGAGSAIPFSGRFNPGFSKKIDAGMVNGFLKVAGFELFGTYEAASGRTKTELSTRKVTQYAVDGVYRFGKSENLFAGLRYNAVTARLAGFANDITINRFAVAGGWFITSNVLLKAEYVDQHYNDFPATDYRSTGRFHGYVVEAVVGF